MGKKKNKESMEDKLYNLQAQQLAAQVANWAAQLDFQKERFRLLEMPQFQQGLQLEVDKFAWEKAEDTWARAFQEASITGMYQGQPTTQWLMDQARLTGSYNGERTLEGRLTDAQIQDMQDKMKLANDQFLSATTGFYNGQKTFDREKFEAAQALEGWKFLATLSGPQNAFKQARAIGSMPGGVPQMMQAFAGQYMLPSGAAVGAGGAAGQLNDLIGGWQSTPNPAATRDRVVPVGQMDAGFYVWLGRQGINPGDPSLADRIPEFMSNYASLPLDQHQRYIQEGNANPGNYQFDTTGWGGAYGIPNNPWLATPSLAPASGIVTAQPIPSGEAPSRTAQGYTYDPPGVQAPVNAYNYSGTNTGSVAVYPPGVVSPAATPDVSSSAPINPSSVSPLVNQPYQYGGRAEEAAAAMPTFAPNKIDARNFSNAYQYQKDLLWAGFEEAGYDQGLAQEAFLRSLPKYGSNTTRGAVAF